MVDKATLESLLGFGHPSDLGDPEDPDLLSRNVQPSSVAESVPIVLELARSPGHSHDLANFEDVVLAVPVPSVVFFDHPVFVLDCGHFVVGFISLVHVSILGPGPGQVNRGRLGRGPALQSRGSSEAGLPAH